MSIYNFDTDCYEIPKELYLAKLEEYNNQIILIKKELNKLEKITGKKYAIALVSDKNNDSMITIQDKNDEIACLKLAVNKTVMLSQSTCKTLGLI